MTSGIINMTQLGALKAPFRDISVSLLHKGGFHAQKECHYAIKTQQKALNTGVSNMLISDLIADHSELH